MKQLKENHSKELIGLFPEYRWNYIADSILEGYMGQVLVDDQESPNVVALTLPEQKIHILGGDAGHAAARDYLAGLKGFSMLLTGSLGWKELLDEVHPGKIITLKRYAFNGDSLDIEHLKKLASGLSDDFWIVRIDLKHAQKIMAEKNEMTEDQMFGFNSAEEFLASGFGFVALEGETIVCIASTGAVCSKGIEVQINTHKKYRGRGLASAVGAALIIEALENGIDPNWDAATEISAGLAEKLGYTSKGEYDFYFYTGSKFLVSLRNFLRRIRGKEI
ncbi:MAG: GNAT family N-acetyltransferase [Chloroflexota bacterium]